MLISSDVNRIAKIVQQGGVIAYPTEAVLGLGCDPYNHAAVQRLCALKQRAEDKGLIVIAANLAQLKPYIESLNPKIEKILTTPQSVPTTWLVPAHKGVPNWITGQYSSVAIRISQHRACQQLCLAVGYPIISTSANPATYPPAKDIASLQAYFNHDIDAFFDAPLGQYQQPSTIRDAVTQQVIRASD